jgi:hypothetical protein
MEETASYIEEAVTGEGWSLISGVEHGINFCHKVVT